MALRIVEEGSSAAHESATVVIESDLPISDAYAELDSPPAKRLALEYGTKHNIGARLAIEKIGKIYNVDENGVPMGFGPIPPGTKVRARRDFRIVATPF